MLIKLHFIEANAFPQQLVVDLIQEVNQTYFELEQLQILRFLDEFPDTPQILIDAALFRMGAYRESAVRIEAATPGSLTLILVGTALGYWILQNTVGESFKDAWKESNLHEKIKEFFVIGHKKNVQEIANRFERPSPFIYRRSSQRFVQTKTEVSRDEITVTITVLEQSSEERIPTYEELPTDKKQG